LVITKFVDGLAMEVVLRYVIGHVSKNIKKLIENTLSTCTKTISGL